MSDVRRERDPVAKRARITARAMELFSTRGYAETTIEEIAAAAEVGRRTVFEHFPSKEAILFDHFEIKRDVMLQQLAGRPVEEPPLGSLHAVLRARCEEGYDRDQFLQIKRILAANPTIRAESLSVTSFAFVNDVAELMRDRTPERSWLELQAISQMACGWFLSALRLHFRDSRSSLVETFDSVVRACVSNVATLP